MTVALKAIDNSNNEVRFEVAHIFGKLANYAVNNKTAKAAPLQQGASAKVVTLEDVLGFMSAGFLRGGIGGFLKTSTGAVAGGHKEIRVGIALVSLILLYRNDCFQAYVEVARELGTKWLERNLFSWQKHLVEIAYRVGPLFYTK
jgi:hypothetical protein